MQATRLSGQILLASPSLRDPNFANAVVLICHHDSEGCMGLVINRPGKISLLDVLNDLGFQAGDGERKNNPASQRVFEGGPVDSFRGFILHDGWHIYESTMQITPELHLTTSNDVLEELAHGDGPEHYLMMLGYSGWGAGQLEQELSNNDWLIAPLSDQIIFHESPEQRWNFGARCMGFDRTRLSSQIGHA